jgi:hypothetical protein
MDSTRVSCLAVDVQGLHPWQLGSNQDADLERPLRGCELLGVNNRHVKCPYH